jgi:hypothetical protein
MYAGALYSITRADGAVERDEHDRLREMVARRWRLDIDPVALFFTVVTPESFAHAVRRSGAPFRESAIAPELQVGRALVQDAVELSVSTGTLSDDVADAILRYARALGCTTEDIQAATDRLAAWLE